jgi:hypothetical protein
MKVKNYSPDSDCIVLSSKGYKVTISRDERGEVYVSIKDKKEGSHARMVLGSDSMTHKL